MEKQDWVIGKYYKCGNEYLEIKEGFTAYSQGNDTAGVLIRTDDSPVSYWYIPGDKLSLIVDQPYPFGQSGAF